MSKPVRSLAAVTSLALLLAGCGSGSDVTAEQRIDRCLEQQPDATEAECQEWEEQGELHDDGTHEGHEPK